MRDELSLHTERESGSNGDGERPFADLCVRSACDQLVIGMPLTMLQNSIEEKAEVQFQVRISSAKVSKNRTNGRRIQNHPSAYSLQADFRQAPLTGM